MYAFSPYFHKITSFGLIHICWLLPYFDHDVFTHHALHVLDAPDKSSSWPSTCPLNLHLNYSFQFPIH